MSYGTSEEIVAHIVQHCDDNTALSRQPQTGPRKYKRRRKLKPHETNTVVRKNEFSYDMMESTTGGGGSIGGGGGSDSEDNTKRKLGKKNKQHRSNVEEGYQNVLKSFESSLQNINSIVSNSKLNASKSKLSKKKLRKEDKKETQSSNQSGRPKMIHTQKTRVPVEVGSDGAKKGQKTKTMVTRTPKVMPNEHKSGIFPGGERNRPRTKNVSYHIEGKLQVTTATFPAKPMKEDMSTQQQQQQLLVNIKQEPGIPKATGDNRRNNNGNILALGKNQESSTKKRSTTLKRSKRQKTIVKQEFNETVEPDAEEQQQQHLQLQNNNNNNNNNMENSGDPSRLMEHTVDGSNLEVAFEASVVTAQEEDQDEEESILPHDATEEMDNVDNSVKLSVKVESAPQTRMLAVHSVITPVDDVPETIIPDAVEYTCEMCAAVFSSRAELLVHVPIHIWFNNLSEPENGAEVCSTSLSILV